MSNVAPIRLGLAGLGGYAGFLCDRILEQTSAGSPAVSLVAACDPSIERFGARVRDLNAKGIKVVRSFEQLLSLDIEAVWLPLPIDLHRSFTETALAAGKAVMCEKPAAGCVDDVDAMIVARDRAGLPALIGFQDIYQPSVGVLKQRMVAGEFGKPTSATVIGCWPRSERYFGRNEWAGKMQRDGRWVMDSPATNALSHFVNLAMFLVGPKEEISGTPTQVAAELYRANRIENFDTCSLRITLNDDVPLFVAYTHACAITVDPVVTIETEKSVIRYVAGRHIEIRTGDKIEHLPLYSQPHPYMLRAFQNCLRGGSKSALCASLEMAREHIVAMNVVSESSPVIDVPSTFIETHTASDHAPLRTIRDITAALQTCTARKCLLHETGLASWSTAAAARTVPANYSHFAGPHPSRVTVTTHTASIRRPTTAVTH